MNTSSIPPVAAMANLSLTTPTAGVGAGNAPAATPAQTPLMPAIHPHGTGGHYVAYNGHARGITPEFPRYLAAVSGYPNASGQKFGTYDAAQTAWTAFAGAPFHTIGAAAAHLAPVAAAPAPAAATPTPSAAAPAVSAAPAAAQPSQSTPSTASSSSAPTPAPAAHAAVGAVIPNGSYAVVYRGRSPGVYPTRILANYGLGGNATAAEEIVAGSGAANAAFVHRYMTGSVRVLNA